MNENRHEETDPVAFSADHRGADDDRENPPGPDSAAAEEEARAGPADPDLAKRAARAEPSDEAKRIEYDPAAEDV